MRRNCNIKLIFGAKIGHLTDKVHLRKLGKFNKIQKELRLILKKYTITIRNLSLQKARKF